MGGAAVTLGMVEFYGLARACGMSPFKIVGVCAGVAVAACSFFWGPVGLGGSAAAACAVCLAASLGRRSAEGFGDGAVTAVGVLYVSGLFSFVLLLREGPGLAGFEDGAGFTAAMYAFAATWCCDTSAYLVGRAIGRHKLFPAVSPKKSWEGALAGLAGSVGGAALVNWTFGGSMAALGLVEIGLVAGVLAQLGDLVESRMKRMAGVKDSSNFIPGHGGVLDRFDGFLFVAPFVYFYLRATGFAGL